jgi:hypothetical protein
VLQQPAASVAPANQPQDQEARRRDSEPNAEWLEYCDLDGIPAPPAAGHAARVPVRRINGTPPTGSERWILYARRSLGATDWQVVRLRLTEALTWEQHDGAYELLIHHGRLTGRALVVRATSDQSDVEVRALSYTDSGPPFQFEWSGLRAEVWSSREAGHVVGEGWLLVRVRGVVDFEGQGPTEGAICGMVWTA